MVRLRRLVLGIPAVLAAMLFASHAAAQSPGPVPCTAARESVIDYPVQAGSGEIVLSYARVKYNKRDYTDDATITVRPHATYHGVEVEANPSPQGGADIEVKLYLKGPCPASKKDLKFMVGPANTVKKGKVTKLGVGNWFYADFRWDEVTLVQSKDLAPPPQSGFVILSN